MLDTGKVLDLHRSSLASSSRSTGTHEEEEEALLGTGRADIGASRESDVEMQIIHSGQEGDVPVMKTNTTPTHIVQRYGNSAPIDESRPSHVDLNWHRANGHHQEASSPGSWKQFDFSHEAAARDLSMHLSELAHNNPALKVHTHKHTHPHTHTHTHAGNISI